MKSVCSLLTSLTVVQAASEDALSLLQQRSKFVLGHNISEFDEFSAPAPEDFCNKDFKLTEPTVSTLGTPGGMIKYPSVAAGVDLIVTLAGGTYRAKDASLNGKMNGFGNINMMAGSDAVFQFSFVKSGTTEPVVVPKVSWSLYDLDEGKRGRSRGSIATCGAEASFIPSTTELSQVRGANGCFKTSSCARGVKGNEPTSPDDVSPDALKRSVTYSYAGKSSFTVQMGASKGKGARNYLFSLDPIGACRLTTTTTTTTTMAPEEPTCQGVVGPYKMCRADCDPAMEQNFVDPNQPMHHPFMTFGIQRAAKSKDGQFELQTFHCPMKGHQNTVSIICAIAVKMGATVVKYIAKDHSANQVVPLTYLDGTGVTASAKVEGGNIHMGDCNPPGNDLGIRTDHKVDASFTDHAGKWSLSFGVRNLDTLELGFQLYMSDDIIDKAAPGEVKDNFCENGFEKSQANFHLGGDRNDWGNKYSGVDYWDWKSNLFGMQDTKFICNNLMNGLCAGWQDQGEIHVESVEDVCKAMNISFADAKAACTGFTNKKITDACQFEYCQDFGMLQKEQIREIAVEDEKHLEAQGEAEAAYERDFVPEECCANFACDKTIAVGKLQR